MCLAAGSIDACLPFQSEMIDGGLHGAVFTLTREGLVCSESILTALKKIGTSYSGLEECISEIDF